ncbi:MAG: DUF1328 domain-containing protein [Alphaproteobacteria bacterium]|nr:DUF1328 domain-containing protein [Alphaproteobacteria bacterium]
MLGWTIGFFVAALIAAAFGFTGIATAFSGVAQLLFWIFLGLLALSLVLTLFSRHRPGVAGGARTAALVAVAATIGFFAHAWYENGMNAERVGRSIDRTTVALAQDVGVGLEEAGERTQGFVTNVASTMRADAAGALDDAGDRLAPEKEAP